MIWHIKMAMLLDTLKKISNIYLMVLLMILDNILIYQILMVKFILFIYILIFYIFSFNLIMTIHPFYLIIHLL